MSTSIAAKPAYLGSISRRTKAKPDRTIFGTTLDNYQKCRSLLSNQKALHEAELLYKKKRQPTWQRHSLSRQGVADIAWGLRDQKQFETDEQQLPGYFAQEHPDFGHAEEPSAIPDQNRLETLREVASRASSRQSVASCFARNRNSRTKSAVVGRNLHRPGPQRVFSAQLNTGRDLNSTGRYKSSGMANMKATDRQPSASQAKIKVPKFRIPPNATNLLRTASLKITETGAKDLISAKEINKIGLGDTLQYNHEAFKQKDFPEFYQSHGDVRLLGQRFRDDTTNSDITAPGGYLRLATPDREINKRGTDSPPSIHWTPANTMHEEKSRKETRNSGASTQSEITEDEIPLNIRHKFGRDNVMTLIRENKEEVKRALRCPTQLRHSGIVPPRSEVKELNHPIDPPPAFFETFGKNLKYKETEGGLHMYIK